MNDHLDRLDAEVFARLGSPVAGEGIAAAEAISAEPYAIIERPRDALRLQGAQVAHTQPLLQLPMIWAPELRKSQELFCEGRRWRVASAPLRPGDGRIWEVVLDDLGPTGG